MRILYLRLRTIATSDVSAVRIFIRRSASGSVTFDEPASRRGYDSTPYDHYNYATSWRLLMAILLPHLIAPADCCRRFSWVLSTKRVVDNPHLRAKRPSSLEFMNLIFNVRPKKNVKVTYLLQIIFMRNRRNFIPTFCRNFRRVFMYCNYRIPPKNYYKRDPIRELCVAADYSRQSYTFRRIGISIYCEVARILTASNYVPRIFSRRCAIYSSSFFVLISLNFFHEMRDLQFSILAE